MQAILTEIEQALDRGLYYMAIMLSLAIPDICVVLESSAPDPRPPACEYHRWYRQWLQPKYPKITEDDIYALRCGIFHRGRLNDPRRGLSYERIVFTLPTPNSLVLTNCVLNGAYFTDAKTFCTDMIASANAWYAAKQADPNVKRNLLRLVQYRPDGLKPYIVGVPVVA